MCHSNETPPQQSHLVSIEDRDVREWQFNSPSSWHSVILKQKVIKPACSTFMCPHGQWRRPGAEFGGDGKFVCGPKFLNYVFFWKKFSLSRQKILMTFFNNRPGFSDFYSLFSDFYCVKCRIWPFLHKKHHYFRTKFLDDTYFFTLFVLSRPSDNTTFQNIGGPMHGPSPHLKCWGDRPPSPPEVSAPAHGKDFVIVCRNKLRSESH